MAWLAHSSRKLELVTQTHPAALNSPKWTFPVGHHGSGKFHCIPPQHGSRNTRRTSSHFQTSFPFLSLCTADQALHRIQICSLHLKKKDKTTKPATFFPTVVHFCSKGIHFSPNFSEWSRRLSHSQEIFRFILISLLASSHWVSTA